MSLDGRAIGLIEDDPIMGESLVLSLNLEGCQVSWWQTGGEAVSALRRSQPDLLICDIRLPDMTGEAVFREMAAEGHLPPVLFVTAFGDIDQAVALMRAGAGDYLTKPFDMTQFLDRVRGLVERRPARSGDPVLGVSPVMRRIEQLIERLGDSELPVLISGETGVGKEVCARLLHRWSDRSAQPLMAVNCAAIPADLMESELFGHERGAFTGADRQHLGYAERAGGGTLFLDEIAELAPRLQAKLLRLLEDRSFCRVGGERPVPFRARVVCATNRDLESEVAAGRFRSDLFYRINVVELEIPPLRERRDDIAWLTDRLLGGLESQDPSCVRGLGSLAEEALRAHDWPGNVRELRNRLERACALSFNEWLLPGDLFPESCGQGGDGGLATLAEVRDAAEKRQIERALARTNGQIAQAAALLGIARTTMWEKMKRLGIDASPE